MDIDLLSKIVRELILDNDEVILPGVGVFVAEIVPSTFSDKGYTINPPYRRLYFRHKPDLSDDSIAALYSESNNIDLLSAKKIISGFLSEMKEILEQKKVIIFPGLGKLRATKENNFFFVADEDIDIWPGGFYLEPISLKTHQETTDEVSAAVASLRSMIKKEETDKIKDAVVDATIDSTDTEKIDLEKEETEEVASIETIDSQRGTIEEAVSIETIDSQEEAMTDAVKDAGPEMGTVDESSFLEAEKPVDSEEEKVEDLTEEKVSETPVTDSESNRYPKEQEIQEQEENVPVEEPSKTENINIQKDSETVKSDRKPLKIAIITLAVIVALIIIALVIFIVLAHTSPELIDSILYSSDELEIIHQYQNLK